MKVNTNLGTLSQSTLLNVTTLKKFGIVLPITVEIGGILKSLLGLLKIEFLFMKVNNGLLLSIIYYFCNILITHCNVKDRRDKI